MNYLQEVKNGRLSIFEAMRLQREDDNKNKLRNRLKMKGRLEC